MADEYPDNTAELLSEIEREWKELNRVVVRLSPEQMTTPETAGGWSPKDNLAHLTAWMAYMRDCYLGKMPAHEAMGIEREKYEQLDEDGVNAVLWERNRNLSASQVMDQLNRTYASVMKVLREMPFAELMQPRRADDPEQRPVIAWVRANTSAHFAEHRGYIERLL